MTRLISFVILACLFAPAAALADSAPAPDDTDESDDTLDYTCSDLCDRVLYCHSSCVSGNCLQYCQKNVSQTKMINCLEFSSCDFFNSCMCSTHDEDSDDDSTPEPGSSGDDNGDSCGCSVTNSESGAILSLLMLIIGLAAFIFSMQSPARSIGTKR